MRRRLVTLFIAGALAAGSATTFGATVVPTDLFVDDALGACSDTGPGSADTPYCSIQAAANAVLPGQTVHIAAGQYAGQVDITRSGTQGSPITFQGVPQPASAATKPVVNGHGGPGFRVKGAHDVVISGVEVTGSAPGVAVDDSSGVTVTDVFLNGVGDRGDGVDVTGSSSGVTVSRSVIVDYLGDGVNVGAGVTGATVTTNIINRNSGPGVATNDAPSTVVTSNTVVRNCTAGITLAGKSTGSTVENNILDTDNNTAVGASPCTSVPFLAELAVSADSVNGTTADYNLINGDLAHLYSWAGTNYTSPSAFTTATGQGSHDINAAPQFTSTSTNQLGSTSSAIDSANSDAPGELAVDQAGNAHVDDPLRPNTGVGTADRGAVEMQDPFSLGTLSVTPAKGPAPLAVTANVTATNPWFSQVTYTFDFGDGTAPVVTTTPTAKHAYADVRNAEVSVTATTSTGVLATRSASVEVTEPAPLVPRLHLFQVGPLSVEADNSASTDSWQITDYATDFGDGTAVQHGSSAQTLHTYANPGTYTVTTTETDFAGNTDTVSQRFTVGGAYFAVPVQRALDTRDGTGGVPAGKLGPGGVVSLKLAGTNGIPATGVRAVVLNVTAIDPSATSFLTVYADGTTRPDTPSINYVPGQTVTNLVTVPVGANGNVDFFNDLGTVDVTADVQGYYLDRPAFNGGGFATSMRPQRLLDTRDPAGATQGAPVGSGGVVQVRVGQLAQSAVRAVVLNVTATSPTTTSFLTVYPDGTTRPNTSNVNFTKGQTTSNLVAVPADSGTVDIFNNAGSVHVIVDVEAFYTQPIVFQPDPGGTPFTPTQPTRLLDTRTTIGGHRGPLGAGSVAAVQVRGRAGVPDDATSVALNVTALAPTKSTFITVYPDGTARPDTPMLNVGAGQTVHNLVVVPIGADGKVDFFNNRGRVNLVAEVA
ncbi:MAG TPA: right-handed parallel beta-helix repeat-containing protein, partial [Pseudonocardiaceae bacterium]|nr:right-handed parallel beta-helix repeat-containing protein [Pseudonocardiaceae bacterium]